MDPVFAEHRGLAKPRANLPRPRHPGDDIDRVEAITSQDGGSALAFFIRSDRIKELAIDGDMSRHDRIRFL
jgi:hypothetical protein